LLAFESHLLNLVVAIFSFHKSRKTEHYADDLEINLEAAMLDDFGAQLEDGSPREVRVFFFNRRRRRRLGVDVERESELFCLFLSHRGSFSGKLSSAAEASNSILSKNGARLNKKGVTERETRARRSDSFSMLAVRRQPKLELKPKQTNRSPAPSSTSTPSSCPVERRHSKPYLHRPR